MESTKSDESLLTASRTGDLQAFKALVLRYEGKVAGVVKSMLGDTHEAIDVGQEVFIRFYESMDKFKGQSSLGTYLVRIAVNLSINELKKRQRDRKVFRPEEDGGHVAADTPDVELREAIRQAISGLDAEFRTVVTLRLMEGYSTEETAEIMQVPRGTVLSRLSRAQKKLKSVLIKFL